MVHVKVTLSWPFVGAATASFAALYILRRDHKRSQQSIKQQMKDPKEYHWTVKFPPWKN